MKNIKLLTVGLFCLLVGTAIGYGFRGGTQTTGQQSPAPTPSPDFSYYESLFKQKQEFALYDPQVVDLTGDGSSEVVYITAGEGCASCHQQFLHIYDGDREIFWKDYGDPIFAPILGKGFTVFQPTAEGNRFVGPYYPLTYTWDGEAFEQNEKDH